MRLLIALAAVLAAASPSLADVIYLKTGRTLEGTVTKMTETEVVLRMSDGKMRVPRHNVRLIVRERALKTLLSMAQRRAGVGDLEEAGKLFERAAKSKDKRTRRSALRGLKGVEASRARRAKRVEQGLCPYCGIKPSPKKAREDRHAAGSLLHASMLEGSDATRGKAVRACAKKRSDACVEALEGLLLELVGKEPDKVLHRPGELRGEVALALGRAKSPSSIDALGAALSAHPDEHNTWVPTVAALRGIWNAHEDQAVGEALSGGLVVLPDARDPRWNTRRDYYETVLGLLQKITGQELVFRPGSGSVRGKVLNAHNKLGSAPELATRNRRKQKDDGTAKAPTQSRYRGPSSNRGTQSVRKRPTTPQLPPVARKVARPQTSGRC